MTASSAEPPPPDPLRVEAPGGLRLDLLRAFVLLSDELHFTRAAGRLFLSQSGLSRRIRLLESLLDVPLVIRTTREVVLTPAGRSFAADAAEILEAADRAVAAIRLPRTALRSLPAPDAGQPPGPPNRGTAPRPRRP